MFEKMKDLYLQHHVKTQLNNYYLVLGLNPKELEHKTLTELVELVTRLLDVMQKQSEGQSLTIKQQDAIIAGLRLNITGLKEENAALSNRNQSLYERNEDLVKENKQAKEREERYESSIGKIGKQNLDLKMQVESLTMGENKIISLDKEREQKEEKQEEKQQAIVQKENTKQVSMERTR